MGNPDVRIMPHPAMPVAAAQTRGHHLDNHAIRRGCWVSHVLNGYDSPEFFVENGPHGLRHHEMCAHDEHWQYDDGTQQEYHDEVDNAQRQAGAQNDNADF